MKALAYERVRAAVRGRAARCRSSASCRATCGRRCRPSSRSPRAPSARSCSRASSAASGWRATRSSAATPSRGSRCGTARSSCTTPPARTRRRTACSRALRARLGLARPPRSPACRASPAAPSATSPGTRRGSSSGCPTTTARPGDVVASFAFYGSLVAFDHVRQRLVLIALAEPGSRAGLRPRAAGARRLRGGPRLGAPAVRDAPAREPPAALPLTDGGAFRDAVLAAKEHIAAGDIFQVVLSRQHTVDCGIDPFTVYRALRMVNPSPYMYFLKDGEAAVAGASPGDAGARRGPARRDAADRRHAPAPRRPHRRRGRARAAGRREGARRAPDARGPRPQRPRPRLPLRQRAGGGADEGRALQPRGPHRELGRGRARRGQGRPRRARRDLPGGDALGRARRSAPCRSSTSWSRSARGLYGGALGYIDLRRQPRLLHRDPHARCCGPARPRCRPAPASWPTPTPRPRSARPRPRRRRSSRRSRVAGGLA